MVYSLPYWFQCFVLVSALLACGCPDIPLISLPLLPPFGAPWNREISGSDNKYTKTITQKQKPNQTKNLGYRQNKTKQKKSMYSKTRAAMESWWGLNILTFFYTTPLPENLSVIVLVINSHSLDIKIPWHCFFEELRCMFSVPLCSS